MKNDVTTAKFIAIWTKVATLFLTRDHADKFTPEQAADEVQLILDRIGIERLYQGFSGAERNLRLVNIPYIRLSRIGSKVALNRAQRVSIALSLDNAFNHASFEYYYG